jgi:hypothetical protein
MTRKEIKIGAQVFDRTLQRTGMVVAIHRPANPNLDPDSVIIKTAPGALIWARIDHLEQI